MKIYFGHSSSIDYTRLYSVIKSCKLKHEIILPHEYSKDPFLSKDLMKGFGLFVAEVSQPSTGLGIELAWAKDTNVPVVFFFRKNSKLSDCLKMISNEFVEYVDDNDFKEKLVEVVDRL
jgi:hypothetical protein